jgi:hypothetical protein
MELLCGPVGRMMLPVALFICSGHHFCFLRYVLPPNAAVCSADLHHLQYQLCSSAAGRSQPMAHVWDTADKDDRREVVESVV